MVPLLHLARWGPWHWKSSTILSLSLKDICLFQLPWIVAETVKGSKVQASIHATTSKTGRVNSCQSITHASASGGIVFHRNWTWLTDNRRSWNWCHPFFFETKPYFLTILWHFQEMNIARRTPLIVKGMSSQALPTSQPLESQWQPIHKTP